MYDCYSTNVPNSDAIFTFDMVMINSLLNYLQLVAIDYKIYYTSKSFCIYFLIFMKFFAIVINCIFKKRPDF